MVRHNKIYLVDLILISYSDLHTAIHDKYFSRFSTRMLYPLKEKRVPVLGTLRVEKKNSKHKYNSIAVEDEMVKEKKWKCFIQLRRIRTCWRKVTTLPIYLFVLLFLQNSNKIKAIKRFENITTRKTRHLSLLFNRQDYPQYNLPKSN